MSCFVQRGLFDLGARASNKLFISYILSEYQNICLQQNSSFPYELELKDFQKPTSDTLMHTRQVHKDFLLEHVICLLEYSQNQAVAILLL